MEEISDDKQQPKAANNTNAKLMQVLNNKWLFAFLFIAVLLLALYLRSGLLKYQGFYEPDGFFYYALVKATISNNFVMPQILSLSGFPTHQPHDEAPGLAYLPALLYLPLGSLGISALTIMRILPLLVALLEMVGVFFIIKYIFKNNWIGLLAMFFLAVSIANIARTGALVYRGDTFISLILIFSILFTIIALSEKDRRRMYLFCALAAIVLSLGIVMWNGASLAFAIYFIALGVIFCYAFINEDKDLLEKNVVLSVGFLFAWVLDLIFISLKLAAGGYPLYGYVSFLYYLVFVALNFGALYMFRSLAKYPILSISRNRLYFTLILLLVGLASVFLLFGNMVSSYSVVHFAYPSFNSTNTRDQMVAAALVATTVELGKPSLGFLFGSFNVQLILAPLGLILLLFLFQ